MAASHSETAGAPATFKLQVLQEPILRRVLRAEMLQTGASRDAVMALAGEPRRLLEMLQQQGLLADALRFLAHALPAREAVWWGCMCATATLPVPATPQERHALIAAEAWVRQPQAAGLAAAAIAAAQLCQSAPGAWPGLAIQWGAMRAAAGGRAIEGGVLRAARRGIAASAVQAPGADQKTQAAIMTRFLASGVAIASGQSGRIASLSIPEQQYPATEPSA